MLGKLPSLGRDVFVAPSAAVIGDVKLGDNSSVFYGSVIRGGCSAGVAPGPAPAAAAFASRPTLSPGWLQLLATPISNCCPPPCIPCCS